MESCNLNSYHDTSQKGQVIPSDQMNRIGKNHVQTRQVFQHPSASMFFLKASSWTNPAPFLIPTVRV